MPNYVSNCIEVTNDKQIIEKFVKTFVKDGAVDFNLVIPTPEDIDLSDDQETIWRNDNWGVEFNALDTKVKITEGLNSNESVVNVFFNTAWKSPIAVIDRLAKLNPDLVLVHYVIDPAWQCYEITEYVDGEVYTSKGDNQAEKEVKEKFAWFLDLE